MSEEKYTKSGINNCKYLWNGSLKSDAPTPFISLLLPYFYAWLMLLYNPFNIPSVSKYIDILRCHLHLSHLPSDCMLA